MIKPIVLAITGASGAIYAVRLLACLARARQPVHLTISPSGLAVIQQELQAQIDLARFHPAMLFRSPAVQEFIGERGDDLPWENVVYHHYQNFMSPIASGSFLTSGMVICPCSGGTVSAIAHGSSTNLIHRAADVHLKEHRKLIVVPRETPLSVIQLENLKRLAEVGAIVLPAMPGWYHGVRSLRDLIDFIVARILDQLGMEHDLMRRWGSTSESQDRER